MHDLDRSGMSLSIVVDGAVGIRKHGERDQLLPRERGPDSEEHHEVREGGADLGVLQDDVEEATPDGQCDVEMPIRLIIFDDVLRTVAEDGLPHGVVIGFGLLDYEG